MPGRTCTYIILFALLFCLFPLPNAIAGNRVVRVGMVYDNRPVIFLNDQGGAQGIAADMLNETARVEQWQLQYIPGTLPECFKRLNEGKIDLLVGIAWSAARAEKYRFNEKTILNNWAQLYSTPGNDLTSILSLDGKTIALMEKSIHSTVFRDLVQKFNLQVTLLPVASYQDALQTVAAKQADAALVNRLFGLKMGRDYQLVKTPIIFNPIELRYITSVSGEIDLLQSIDATLTRLEADPESLYFQSVERWLSGKKQLVSFAWLKKLLNAALLLLALATCAVLYFRRQVRRKTLALTTLLEEEKTLRRALTSSEEKFRRAFQTSPDSIALNRLDGTYVEINAGFCHILGYSPEEVIGKTSHELNIWKDTKDRDKLITALQETGLVENMEAEFVCKDKSIATGLMSAVLLEIDHKPHTLSITRDISAFKKQQQALQQSERRWQQTFDAIGDIITVQDKDMHILQANRAASGFFGSDDLSGKFCFQLLHGSPVPCSGCPVPKTFTDGAPHSTLIQHTEQGKTFAVTTHPILSSDNTTTQVVQVARDVTEHMAMEQERKLLAEAIEQSSDTIVVTDIDAVIRYANPAFEQHSGYSRTEAIGQKTSLLQSGQHNEAFYNQLWSTILSGETWQGVFINRKKSGELYEEKATISPVKDHEGNFVNFIAVKRDITHERHLEQQLQQAQKLESIGTLAGGIAHDFNNILGAILGYAELALLELPDKSRAKEDVTEIIVAGQRAAELVKQILTFSRQDKEEFHPVSVQLILKETLKLLKASLPSTIILKQMVDTTCKPVMGDATRLHQVILNLCTNAKHALNNKKGTISVSLQPGTMCSPAGKKDANGPGEGNALELTVTDNGCGMDHQTVSRIFDPFFTTKSKGQGTGLGLAVTHGIVKQHGGEITVQSTPGKGTTFHITLPTVKTSGDPVKHAEKVPLALGSERVVLVDDEEYLVEVVERMLTDLGYTVFSFTGSRPALLWMENHLDEFDILVTDMTMPDITGADLIEKLLALRPNLPIIVCTGFSETLSKEQAVGLGVRAYLPKPVTRYQLAKNLDQVLHS